MKDYSSLALDWARSVSSGDTLACKWTRLSAERFLRDLSDGESRGLVYDASRTNRICHFLELLPHIKGDWARRNETLALQPWQIFVHANLYGWQRWSDEAGRYVRRFLKGYEEVSRKNGKSFVQAGRILYAIGPEEEPGAECVCAAASGKQATQENSIFWTAHEIVNRCEPLRSRYGLRAMKYRIVRDATSSSIFATSRESGHLHGLMPYFVAMDELHAHKTREVYDVLLTGMGSREEPLMSITTTAGDDETGICFEERLYATHVLEGILKDDQYFAVIFTVDDPDNWENPDEWRKANPNLGISVKLESFAMEARKAKSSASATATFKRDRLNIWSNVGEQWADMDGWRACGDASLQGPPERPWAIPEKYNGWPAFIGLDLSSKVDICSSALVLDGLDEAEDGGITVFSRNYLPAELVHRIGTSMGAHYLQWAKDNWLTLLEGTEISYSAIEKDILELAERFQLRFVAHDPWQAHHLVMGLMANHGLLCVEIQQTTKNFSPAMKEAEAMVIGRRIRHPNNPIATWMWSNIVARRDNNGELFPRRDKSNRRKIDFGRALLSGISYWVRTRPDGKSVYDNPEYPGMVLTRKAV